MKVARTGEEFNTGLSESQIADAFSRALGDYSDQDIDDMLSQKVSQTDYNNMIAKFIDGSGSKNILNWVIPASASMTVVDNGDGTFTASGSPSAVASLELMKVYGHAGEEFHLSGCPAGGNQATRHSLLAADQSGSMIGADTGSGLTFTAPEGETYFRIYARFRPYTYSNLVFAPMLCSKAIWDISDKFVPYYPSLGEMWAAIKSLQS